MVEADVTAKWEAWSWQGTSDLQLHAVEPAGSQSPRSASSPSLPRAPLPFHPQLLWAPWCQTGEGTGLSCVSHLAVAVTSCYWCGNGKGLGSPRHIWSHSRPPSKKVSLHQQPEVWCIDKGENIRWRREKHPEVSGAEMTSRWRRNCFWSNSYKMSSQTGRPVAGSRDAPALNEGDFHGARETQRCFDSPRPANRCEQQQGTTDLRNCVEKAMKGAQVKADLTRPPGCTNEVSQMTSVKLFSTPFVTLGGQSGRGEIVQFK